MKKNNFKISKKIKTYIVGSLLAFAFILVFQATAQIGMLPITILGNTDVSVTKLQLAPKPPLTTGKLDDNSFNTNALNFNLVGSSILDNLIVTGDSYFSDAVYLGYADQNSVTETADLQVNGNILIKDLAHADCLDTASCDAIPDIPLCTNDFGVLERCN